MPSVVNICVFSTRGEIFYTMHQSLISRQQLVLHYLNNRFEMKKQLVCPSFVTSLLLFGLVADDVAAYYL